MFRKLQLKFFAFTTSVILALFVAMLVAINVIMDVVMQQESKVVLKQIASSIEYDEETSTFTYFELRNPPPDIPDQPPKGTPPTEPNNGTTSGTDAPTDPSTDVPGSSQGYSPTDPVETLPPQTSVPYTQGDTTQTAPQTSAPRQTTTQPAKPTAPNIQTGIPQEPATSFEEPPQELPTEPYPPFEEQPPTRPPREDPPYDDPHYNENYNNDNNDDRHDNDYHQYPEPIDPNFRQYYEALPYESDEPTAPAVTTEAETAPLSFSTVTDQLIPLSASIGVPFSNISPAAVENQRWEEAPVPKSLGSIEFFVLMADQNGNYLASLNNDDLTSDAAQSYVTSVLGKNGSEGMLDQLQYCTLAKPNGTIMVFTDRSASFDMLDQLTHTTIIIGIIAFLFITLLTFFLSKKSIQPVKTAFEKQKQFISDASHELKTPLTIISANTDVLADEIGDNKWLEYIRSQTDRMNILVNDLLNLTRLENNTAAVIFTDFNLSKAIENTALPFECQAFEMNRTLEIDIQDNIVINGSEQHIKQMAAIFIDNALKYSNEGGKVRVSLKTQNDKPVLSVYNTGMGINESEKDKIFERFYRIDDSRARTTGGYGLGLAIAKTIIDKHKFKVSIDNTEGVSVCFNIFM